MQSKTNNHANGGTTSGPSRTAPPVDPYLEIASLTQRGGARTRFMAGVLRATARHFGSPYAALHVRYASEVLQDDCHHGPTDPRFWRDGLQQFLTESLTSHQPRAKLLRARNGDVRVAFLSSPIVDGSGPAIGALALVAPVRGDDELPLLLATLEGLCRCASLGADLAARPAVPGRDAPLGDRAVARAATCATPEELAFALTNELRNKLTCEQVALGLVEGRHVHPLSISGLDHIPPRSPGAEALRAAMEECLDARDTLKAHKGEKWGGDGIEPVHRLHRQWRDAAAGDAVASIPLRIGEEISAIISLRKRSDRGWSSEELEQIRARIEPFVPALRMLKTARRGLARHAWDVARTRARWLLAPGRPGRKIGFATLALLGAWFCFGTAPYALTVRGVVAPAVERHISAPFEAALAEAFVTGGDMVAAGDPLCRFDTRELNEQQDHLVAEVRVLERRQDQALAARSAVDVKLAEANLELARAKLAIVRGRIVRAILRAPFDGVVVWGDLRRHVGAVIAEGTPLFVVAPRHGWRVELSVPEGGADEFPLPTTGSFAAFSRPEELRSLEITRVLPTAEARHHGNVFVAEARMVDGGDWLRPGMEGIVRVHAGSRRVWWVALHGAIDWMRLHLWL